MDSEDFFGALVNDFEPVVFKAHPELARIRDSFRASGASKAIMTESRGEGFCGGLAVGSGVDVGFGVIDGSGVTGGRSVAVEAVVAVSCEVPPQAVSTTAKMTAIVDR